MESSDKETHKNILGAIHKIDAETISTYGISLPADVGVNMAKANKILRDIDREYGFKLKCSDIIGQWAFYQD